ncbi:formate dehydrogenase [uncultured Methanobrevibacter sp.]|uniref:formate dehydrogenase n=1 Tax=uncultured Methanobrevibacter sp. TaxID=253161 RepID=UPI002635BCCD|nr:formate dehydrogenase [uncultured Methanobrevibacter sp.]
MKTNRHCTHCEVCKNCQHPLDVDDIPLFCMECSPDKAPCLKICPENAIECFGGAITLNKSKCAKCGKCKNTCPIGILDNIIKH